MSQQVQRQRYGAYNSDVNNNIFVNNKHQQQYFPLPQNPENQNNIIRQAPQHIRVQQKSDEQFFNNLQHYTPICYSGSGTPIFMSHRNWYISISCLLILDGIFILALALFGATTVTNQASLQVRRFREQQQKDKWIYILITSIVLLTINLTYLLTVFLNPGVINPSNISEQQFKTVGKKYCAACNNYRTAEMSHCSDCRVCVQDLDHHCGFFGKCIAGWQKFAFYAFLTSLFGGFIMLIVTMSSTLNL